MNDFNFFILAEEVWTELCEAKLSILVLLLPGCVHLNKWLSLCRLCLCKTGLMIAPTSSGCKDEINQ